MKKCVSECGTVPWLGGGKGGGGAGKSRQQPRQAGRGGGGAGTAQCAVRAVAGLLRSVGQLYRLQTQLGAEHRHRDQ